MVIEIQPEANPLPDDTSGPGNCTHLPTEVVESRVRQVSAPQASNATDDHSSKMALPLEHPSTETKTSKYAGTDHIGDNNRDGCCGGKLTMIGSPRPQAVAIR